jgi:hypothetical protein
VHQHLREEFKMASNYIKKINDLPIAASQAAPGSELAQRLATLESGSFAVVPLTSTTPIVPNPSGASPAVDLSNKIIYLTKDSTVVGEDKYKEWIYTGSTTTLDNSKWEVIGTTSLDLSGYKTVQTAVSDPTASGTSITFIATISQDTNGVITATKKSVSVDNTLSGTSTNPVQNKVIKTALAGKKDTQSAVSDPTASGTSITFIDSISQDAQGVITPTKKTVSTMGAASSDAAGTAGLVPAPGAGKQNSFLRGDGTWQTPTNTDTKVTQTKLGGTETGAYPIILKNTTTATDSTTGTVNYMPGITVTPSTSTITATNFAGNATTATTAKDYDTSTGTIKSALAGKASSSHTHGDINNNGTISASAVTIANGDAIVITDSTASGKVVKSAASFDGSTTSKALTKKGTFETFYQKASTGIPKTDLASAVQTSLGLADSSVQGVTVNGSSVVNSNKVAVISLADSTSTSGPGTAGVVTLEIVSI